MYVTGVCWAHAEQRGCCRISSLGCVSQVAPIITGPVPLTFLCLLLDLVVAMCVCTARHQHWLDVHQAS